MAGLLATLDQAGAISLRPGQYVGLILAILGAGMLVGAWIGRASWLVFPALLLLPFVVAASLIHVPFRGGVGERIYAPASVTELRPEYRMIAGHLKIDLSGLDIGSSTVTVHASLVAGRLEVVVPAGTTTIVTGTVAAGAADLFDVHRDGTDVPLATTDPGEVGSGVIRLDLGMTYGYLKVGDPTSAFPEPLTPKAPAVPNGVPAPKAPDVSKNVVAEPFPPAPPAPVG